VIGVTGRPMCIWEDTIKMDLNDKGLEGMNRNNLAWNGEN
jgi:hypothetical protein